MSHVVKIKLHNGAEFNVPADMSEKMQKAHAVMQASGYSCLATWSGFQAFLDGKKRNENPFSVITNVIEMQRWDHGFIVARNVNRRKVTLGGNKGSWFLKCKETGEILVSGLKKESEAFSICDNNGWRSFR